MIISGNVKAEDETGVYNVKSDDEGTISEFTNRSKIRITTNGTSTPENYQVKIPVTYKPGMQSSFGDIRFNTTAGDYIDYWIESHTDSDTADVWLELPDAIADPGGDTIWMYYGNEELTDGGVGDDTFLQYHGAADADYLDALVITPLNIIVEGKVRALEATHRILFGLSNDAAGTDDWMTIYSRSDQNRIKNQCVNNGVASVTEEDPSFTANTWYKIRQSHDGTTIIGYYDDNQIGTTLTTNIPDETMGLWLLSPIGTGEQEYLFVRKYITNEPTTSVGITLEDVTITLENGTDYETDTDENGDYSQVVDPDTYTVTASKTGYVSDSTIVDATLSDQTQNFILIRSVTPVTPGILGAFLANRAIRAGCGF